MKCLSTLLAMAIAGFVLTFHAQTATAQQNITSATLSGAVEDANGAYIAAAILRAVNKDTNQRWVTNSDRNGRFQFVYLPSGTYTVTTEATGFTPSSQQVTLTVGQALALTVRLDVIGVAAQVLVTDAGAIETVRTQVAETIRATEINGLPLNGRNYLDLALLVPAVSPTNSGSNQRFAETSAVPGQGISIAGQRNLYNSFIVDGVSANDDAADLTGTYFSQEVIREFQVVTSGGIAEFGRASGGVVNIVTKSGTNNWSGDVYAFARNQRFDARNPLASRKDPLTQVQYGGTMSGPLWHDRTFFFSNFEQARRNYSAVITIAPSAIAAINNRLNAINFGGPRIETGVVPASFDTTNVFARVDHNLRSENQLSGRYSLYHIDAINSRTVGGLNSISRGSGLADTDQNFAFSDIATIKRRMLSETRVQFTRSRLEAPINDGLGPAVSISGVANFGTATSSPTARGIDQLEVVENLSDQHGSHAAKTGLDFLYNRVNIDFPGALQGSYNFTSLNNFLAGNYGTFQQAFGVPNQFQSNPNLGFFVQEEWRVRPTFTINLGLRYDLQFLPQPIETDENNFGPRVGVAYAPNRKTVVRAGAGLFFDRIPLRATSNALQRDGSKYLVVQLSPGQVGGPIFPNVLSVQPTSLPTKPNITRIDPNIETSYSQQFSFQIEREITRETSFSAGYLHLRGLHLILQRNVNVPRFAASAGVPNLGRPDPNWGNISRYESSGNSYYDGMIVSFNSRPATWANVRVSYTLSKTIDNSGNFFFSTPQDNFNVQDDRGLSDNDQRHRLVVSGSLETPQSSSVITKALRGFTLSYVFTCASRLPFNILLGSDRNFDTNNNDRPVGVGRNTGKGFDYASLDLRLTRKFQFSEHTRIELTAEGFNLFNRGNYSVPNNTFGSAATPLSTFGQPTQAADPRQFQFGLKLSF